MTINRKFLPSVLVLFCVFHTSVFARTSDSKDLIVRILLLYREQRYAEAVKLAEKNIKNFDPQHTNLLLDNYVTWQRSLIALEKYEDAIIIGLRAQKISRHDYRIIQGLGEAYYLAGDGERALPYLQRYIAMRTSDKFTGRGYYYMGEIYLRQGRYEHADIAFSTAIHHSSNAYRWWYRLGFTREMAKNKIGAREAYEKALSLNPNFMEVRSRLKTL